MRASTLDQRIAGVSYGWEGARGNSASVQRINGAVVRRNLLPDPRGTTSLYWRATIAGSVVPVSAGGPVGVPTWAKHMPSADVPAGGDIYQRTVGSRASADDPAVVAGAQYLASTGFIASVAGTVRMRAVFRDGSGKYLSEVRAEPISIAPEQWARPEGVFTVPAGTTNLSVYAIYVPATVLSAADGYSGASAGLLTMASAHVDYFDGDSVVNAATINRIAL